MCIRDRVTGEPANINKARELISTIADPKVRGELVKQHLEAINPIQLNTEGKKELDKAVTAASRELLNQSLEGGASSKAMEFAGFIRPDVYRQYKEEYLKTRDPELAKQNTLSWLTSQVLQGKADKTTRYGVATGDNNESYMPYFQRKTKETQAERDARKASITNTVGAIGVTALESPGMLPERELRKASLASEQANGLEKIVTPETLALQKALSTQGKSVTLPEIYNKQIEAFNLNNPDKKIPPLGISPMLQIVDFAHPATLEALANNPTPAIVRRATVEAAQPALRMANNMRGSFANIPFQQRSDSYVNFMTQDLGLSRNHALGLLANMVRESNLNAGAPSGDDGGPGGVWQFKGVRQTDRVKQLVESGDWRGQIRYALYEEPNNLAGGSLAKQFLEKDFTSPQEAADWWMRNWERPADPESGSTKPTEILRSYE